MQDCRGDKNDAGTRDCDSTSHPAIAQPMGRGCAGSGQRDEIMIILPDINDNTVT